VQELARNGLVTSESYLIEDFWGVDESSEEQVTLFADDIRDWLETPKNPRHRENAFGLPDPASLSELWEIKFAGDVVDFKDSETIETPEFRYTVIYEQSAKTRTLKISHFIVLRAQEVRADRLVAYSRAMDRVWDWTWLYITPAGIVLEDTADTEESIVRDDSVAMSQ